MTRQVRRKSILLSAILMAACTAQAPLAAAQPKSQDVASCAPEGRRLASITVLPGDVASIEQSLSWAGEVPQEAHGMTGRSFTLTGSCATSVSGYSLGETMLATGEGFSFSSGYQIEPSDIAAKATVPDTLHVEPPGLDGGSFVMASKVQAVRAGRAIYYDYLGLWSRPGSSIVCTFRIAPDGRPSNPKVLFHSSLPLQSISFFPSADSPAGTISVSQRTGTGAVRLFTLRWAHGGWFSARP